jgi:hypothetical protein
MCDDYAHKEWCGLESRAICGLLKTHQSDRIMLLTVDSFSDIDEYLNISKESDDFVVDAIYRRLKALSDPLPPSQSTLPLPLQSPPLETMKSKIIMVWKNAYHPLLPWIIIVGLISYILGTLSRH